MFFVNTSTVSMHTYLEEPVSSLMNQLLNIQEPPCKKLNPHNG